ncbi:hypothetical protein [Litchfieldia salsa]|uniref:Uncharacterized protein n=1 Tax=Litchfieldia salsa TaxID=930152 RepID=A0A1H0VP61_9BACI|nr:hypothetical protein [Litchfieldia salsa]SDP80307.1 hypothetical protein SAMN05216565_107122 [Litchfieldia salsa]
MATTIPNHLLNDRYWKGLLFLFNEHPKLKKCFTTKYFDLKNGNIKVTSLKRLSDPWSRSEKVMLNLALHLFNERYKFNLSDLDSLDSKNMNLAFKAMKMRFL